MTRQFTHAAGGMLLIVLTTAMGGCNSKLKTERDALYAQNEELQSELDQTRAALDTALNESQQKDRTIADLRSQLASRPKVPPKAARNPFAGVPGVETVQRPGGVAVRIPGDVLFSPGKVNLKSSSKRTLKQVTAIILREYPGKTIRVEGYTDTDPIRKSGWHDNWELSSERALAVLRFMRKQGIAANRIYAAGFGQTHPRSSKTKSRRVEIAVVNE